MADERYGELRVLELESHTALLWEGYDLGALSVLVTADAERAEVRTALLQVLPTANPETADAPVVALRSGTALQSWLAWLTNSD